MLALGRARELGGASLSFYALQAAIAGNRLRNHAGEDG